MSQTGLRAHHARAVYTADKKQNARRSPEQPRVSSFETDFQVSAGFGLCGSTPKALMASTTALAVI